jgi:hypothetical protein
VAVFKGFAGNCKVGEFLFVTQWQFYREFAIAFGIHGVVVFLLVEDDMAIAGINVFTDRVNKSLSNTYIQKQNIVITF